MYKVMLFCASMIALLVALGFASNVHAEERSVALCVGCTSNAQFKGAAWQAAGYGYTQGTNVLVVNPDTGLSKWVFLENLPPGVGRNVMPATGVGQKTLIQPGVATPLDSNPLAAIYYANASAKKQSLAGFASQSAWVTNVSGSQQAAINTAIKLTKKTYFVQLDPSTFPSYEGSMGILIANKNYAALSAVSGLGWPPSGLFKAKFSALLKILGVYTGHSFMVCDVFGNGDSACFVPDPFNNDILTQTGPAKNVNGDQLPDITNHVPYDGGEGLGVTLSPPNVRYFLPDDHVVRVVCGIADGFLRTCIMPR